MFFYTPLTISPSLRSLSSLLMRFLYSPPMWCVGLVYYGVWFGCILLATQGRVWWALILMILYGVWILWPQSATSWFLALGCFCYGLLIDGALVYGGYMSFPLETQMWTPSPLWLGSFWFASIFGYVIFKISGFPSTGNLNL